ncbi:Uncharacterized protein At4g02000 [Linum perenne]
MLSSQPTVNSTSSPAAAPSDRPPEVHPSGDPPPDPSLSIDTTGIPPSPVTAKSYSGAVRGHSSSTVGENQLWIPVGVNDIVLSASNGIKALSLSKDFKEKLCKPWANSVVVRLLGKNVGYPYLCHRLRAIWKPVGNLHIVDLDRNCFLVKFAIEQDYFKALTGGPWLILDHYLVVHQWEQSFRVTNDLPKKMVVWVRFPHLPIHFYHAQVLTSLGNLIGKTVKIDFNTQRAERGRFARIAIEIDLSQPIPPTVLLDGAIQKVEYENLPKLCFECGRVGHESDSCPNKVVASPAPQADPFASVGTSAAIATSSPAPDQLGPWMLVSRSQKRPNKASSSPTVRRDQRTDSPAILEGDLLSEKEIQIEGRGAKSGARGISGIQKGKVAISIEEEGAAAQVGNHKPSFGGSASSPAGLGVATKPSPKEAAKPKRKKKESASTLDLGRKPVASPQLGPSPARTGLPTPSHSGPDSTVQGPGPAPTQANFSPGADLSSGPGGAIFKGLFPQPDSHAVQLPDRTPALTRFRKSSLKQKNGIPSLKPAVIITRTSSSGLSKSATKYKIMEEAKALTQPAVMVEPRESELGNRLEEEERIETETRIVEEMMVDGQPKATEPGRSWDLNRPTCV